MLIFFITRHIQAQCTQARTCAVCSAFPCLLMHVRGPTPWVLVDAIDDEHVLIGWPELFFFPQAS